MDRTNSAWKLRRQWLFARANAPLTSRGATVAIRNSKLVLLAIALGLLTFVPRPAIAFDLDHRLFTADLRRYVRDTGVDYAAWQKHPQRLTRYLASLAILAPQEYDRLSAEDKEALWLNAYEAFSIKIILDHYPIHGTKQYYPQGSLRQIPDVWEAFSTKVAGRDLNLYQIEHDCIRKEVKDYRVHFALACAARSCCATPPFAYRGRDLDEQLNRAQEMFLSKKSNVDFDPKTKVVSVSQVFKWFPLDFAAEAGFEKPSFPPPTDDEIVLAFLARHGPDDLRAALLDLHERARYKVLYRDFDWSLNDASQ